MQAKTAMKVLTVAAIGLGSLGASVGSAGHAMAQNINNACRSNNTATGSSTATSSNNCSNSGDATASAEQQGSASSGSGVAGQVAGVVSSGDTSIDASNRSDDVSVTTGDATGTNAAAVQAYSGTARTGGVGTINNPCRSNNVAAGGSTVASNDTCANTGDAQAVADHSADAASGDGVGGQVIGVVTSAGGSADLVLRNETTDSSVTSGNGVFANASAVDSRSLTFDVGP